MMIHQCLYRRCFSSHQQQVCSFKTFLFVLTLTIFSVATASGTDFKCFATGDELKTAVEAYLKTGPFTGPIKRDIQRMYGNDIGDWCVGNVKNFTEVFLFQSFNMDISRWNTSSAVSMVYMFGFASAFNQDISKWNVASVTDMSYMFYEAESFNQDLSAWNVSSVTKMKAMFNSAAAFNQDISKWNVALVKIGRAHV